MLTIKLFFHGRGTTHIFQEEKVWFNSDSGSTSNEVSSERIGSLSFNDIETPSIEITAEDEFYVINDSGQTVLSKKRGAMGAS